MNQNSTSQINMHASGSIPKTTGVSADERQLMEIWNRTESSYPATSCLHELFEAQVKRNPSAIAVTHGNLRLTYRELNSRANRLACHLQSLGVGQSVPVAVGLVSSPDFAVALLAVLKAGGACVPLDPGYPQQRLQLMLEDVKAPVLLTQRGLLAGIAPASTVTIYFDELTSLFEQETGGEDLSATASPGSVAYIIYTSGSTGTPKGVLLGHRGLVNHSAASVNLYGLSERDRVLQFSSISFDIAIEEMFPTWAAGGTVVLKTASFSLGFSEFMGFVREQAISVLDLPTAYWHEWTNYLHENPRVSLPENLRLVIVGGEKVSAAGLARWQSRVNGKIRWVNTYGPSEASVIATAYEPMLASEPLSAVPIGRPISNTRIHLLDAQLKLVPVGAPGEIYIGGDGVALGYLNRPELTAEKFVRDPFTDTKSRLYRTGDMARYRSNGEIEFLGRHDDQVKIRGFRVEPGEIEEAMGRHENVREAAVITREDVPGNKRLVAYVVFAQRGPHSSDDLRTYLKDRLPDYMVPSSFAVLDAMPMTPNGKIDRRALASQQEPAPVGKAAEATSGASLNSKIAAIWQDVLGHPVGLTDNFFELGGHSLLAARMMHRVGQLVGRPLPLAMLLQAPTVEQLSAALDENGLARYWSSVVAIQLQGSNPPFFCIHGVGGNIVGFRDLGRHMGPTHPFYGLQARGLDGAHPCLKSVEEMATQYLSDIRGVQPEGPYFLGGYSFGGLVAYEMAQQLSARGEQVAFLALFDTAPGHVKPETSSLLKSLSRPTPKFLFSDLPRGLYKGVRRRWRALRVPQTLKNVFFANTRAAEQYPLQPYKGKMTLFRATEKSLRAAQNPYAAWRSLAQGGLEFQDIPGDHYGVLVEPQVAVFAERLKICINEAASRCSNRPVFEQAVS